MYELLEAVIKRRGAAVTNNELDRSMWPVRISGDRTPRAAGRCLESRPLVAASRWCRAHHFQ